MLAGYGNMILKFAYAQNIALGAVLIFACITSFSRCTNYSSDTENINPPILLGIAIEGSGHLITVAAQNLEIGFLGYRLYEGLSEDAVRAANVDTGINCGPFNLTPDAALEYKIEVKPGQTAVTAGTTDYRLCAVNGSLTSGHYVMIRSLIISLTTINTSDPSNVLYVP